MAGGSEAGSAASNTASSAPSSDSLDSLVPHYDPHFHEDYARRLYTVCNPDDPMDAPRNVALMGTFGSGKSSVLKGFLNRLTWGRNAAKTDDKESKRYQNAQSKFHSILQRLDAKLGPIIPPCILVKSSEIMQSVDTKAKHDQIKQDIQKEIVKQLIYSTDPSVVNGSHYRRLYSSRSWRRTLTTAGAVFALALLITTVLSAIPNGIGFAGIWARMRDGQFWGNSPKFMLAVAMAVAAGIATFFVRNLPWKPSSMSASIETIELKADERGNIDIFDKYIDEIVFLIERAKIRFVIFEDLDRVDQFDIYYELRELNTLINDSRQAQGKPPVTFIYVMGDEALDPNRYEASRVFGSKWKERQPGAVTAETKAKFFDVSVYLRPFISPAYDIASVLGDADSARTANSADNAQQNNTQQNNTGGAQVGGNPSNADLLALIRSELPDQRTLLDVKNLYAMTVERMQHDTFPAVDFSPDECLAACAMRIAYPHLTLQIIRRDIEFTSLIHDRDHASDAPLPHMVREFIRFGLFDDNYLAYLVDWESRLSPATFALLQEAADWDPYCATEERRNTWEKPLDSTTLGDLAEALAHHVGLDLIERRCPYLLLNRSMLDTVYGIANMDAWRITDDSERQRIKDCIIRIIGKHIKNPTPVVDGKAKSAESSAVYTNARDLYDRLQQLAKDANNPVDADTYAKDVNGIKAQFDATNIEPFKRAFYGSSANEKNATRDEADKSTATAHTSNSQSEESSTETSRAMENAERADDISSPDRRRPSSRLNMPPMPMPDNDTGIGSEPNDDTDDADDTEEDNNPV
ncbi:hypothetical protein [Bifidobacterium saguinibicoloris]|uniref:YobI family P-loop NTPase n=1 Tax=Bifidobacterium saguinibicoloris TaxID=2834433 RepID=UPI001C59562B|nr:hypothetical protein [Bifidobacterium saguinibicoloris]MBW3080046.1 hypothetical protein [Bifidobacterium saguinibicoloris]